MPSDPVSIALIGLLGVLVAALLTIFLQPIWANYIAPKSQLHVKITPHYFKLPNFLSEGISDYIYNYHLNIRPSDKLREKLLDIKLYDGQFSISVSNKSRSKIDELSIRLSDGRKFFADIEGTDNPTFSGKIMVIGSIDPETTINLHLWTPADASLSMWRDPDKIIVVRASSYDKIFVDVLTVGYVKSKYLIYPKKYVWRVACVLWVIVMIISGAAIVDKFIYNNDNTNTALKLPTTTTTDKAE